MENYLPLITGFVGVILGSLTSVIVAWINSNSQRKLERLKVAIQLAIENRRTDHEDARSPNIKGTKPLYPFSSYIFYSYQIIKLVDDEKLNAESLQKLHAEHNNLEVEILKETDKKLGS